ncbi:EI24 domain-containing protein [Sphingobium sp. Cam5-1]|uniref:EI24 domain-containing protein n=1 Tax=Sphingobium sp. Cam5-1 TaxID=2789327 RepID=UPI0018AD1CD2|nr:EI24 domain-containing protein [Sphingobium sp. Cam5-1]QPI72535.1 EI24 domain-containing protein [Sphingobium sp. Cam5-1]
MVIAAALRAFPVIFHRAALRLLAKTLMLTLLIFALAGLGLWTAVHATRAYFGWSGGGSLAEAVVTTLSLAALAWLLFRTIAMAVMNMFADDIVAAVERDSYPAAAAAARPLGFAPSLRLALASAARTAGWNMLALPVYLLLLVTGIGTILLFLALNAYLLGRDLSDMVEQRHPGLSPIPRLGRWLMGLVSALMFLIPFINLLAPVWSAAMAVHMLHGVRNKSR